MARPTRIQRMQRLIARVQITIIFALNASDWQVGLENLTCLKRKLHNWSEKVKTKESADFLLDLAAHVGHVAAKVEDERDDMTLTELKFDNVYLDSKENLMKHLKQAA